MYITRHQPPASPRGPDFDALVAEAGLWRGVATDMFGDDDVEAGAEALWAKSMRSEYRLTERFVARDGSGSPLGVGSLSTPRRENLHLAEMGIVVDPRFRRRGIGSALYDEMTAAARAHGRRTFQSFTWEPLEPAGERSLKGVQGDGALDPDGPSARFLLGRGFRLIQIETMSGLDVPSSEELDAAASAARAATPADYEVLTWRGATPDELLSDMALLHVAMSSDVPMGDADVEPAQVDPKRVLDGDNAFLAAGLDLLFAAVRHVPSGRLVAFTRLIREPDRAVAGQWETLVLRDHRGHGLGMLAKTHNHAVLPAVWPQVRRLITGNASENEHMLAINRRLGYRPIAASGWFELRTDA